MVMAKTIQAKDVPERDLLEAVRRKNETPIAGVTGYGACWWVLADELGFPERVVLARLRAFLRRGLVTGCDCSCRGDFRLTEAGREALAAAP